MLQATDGDKPTGIIHSGSESANDEDALTNKHNADEGEVRNDHDPTGKRRTKKLGCCGATLASVVGGAILLSANSLTFMLLVGIGDILRILDESFGTNRKIGGHDETKTMFQSEEHRELVLFVLAVIAQATINIVIIYSFFCKHTDQSRRLVTAGVAVFGCFQRHRVPNEAIVPWTEILDHICKSLGTAICETFRFSSKIFILPILGFVLGMLCGLWTVLLVVLPPTLWLILWKLFEKEDMFNQDEHLESFHEQDAPIERKVQACEEPAPERPDAIELLV